MPPEPAMSFDYGQPFTKKLPPNPSDFPSRADSRQSSRLGWYSPFPPTSSPTSHSRMDSYGNARFENKEGSKDDAMSGMDARRFTPNLHASLVSEILSLRREIESKNNALTALEETLQNSKFDNGQLTTTINTQEREIRSAKKQMQLLENGTLSALGDLAKERDDAVDTLSDVRKRLEASRSTVRAHEEDAKRNQTLWEQDKQTWDNEKRNMERKVHLAEGRLKMMVTEVAAVQANNQLSSVSGSEAEEINGETWFSNWSDIISTRSSSVRGRYHLSELSHNTYDTNELANLRNSTCANNAGSNGIESNSLTLADELNFGDATEDHSKEFQLEDGIISPDALPEENPFKPRRMSIQSQDHKARRVLGLPIESMEQVQSKEASSEQTSMTMTEKPPLALQDKQDPNMNYQEIGTQYTPPSSPKPTAWEPEKKVDKDLYRNSLVENTANQRRKRVSVANISHDPFAPKMEPSAASATASIACQTVTQPISPPLVPMIALEPMFPDPSSISSPELKSIATQTEDEKQNTGEHAGTRSLIPSTAIPVIAIHPPGSRPGTSYNDVVLPPQTRNVACQTTVLPSDLRSVAVQTEGIRVDRRPLQVPPRLMSVAAPAKSVAQNGRHSRRPIAKQHGADLKDPPPVEPPRPRPINIPDIAAKSIGFSSGLASPTKSDNPFAGFSDQDGSGMEMELSDDDDDFANVAPIRKTLSKVQNSWKLVPASMSTASASRPFGRPISDIQEIDDTLEAGPLDLRANGERLNQSRKKEGMTIASSTLNNADIRKAALISSGALAHTRQRSPSEPGPSTASTAVPPPFPVPTRSSSRKIPISASEGNGSPTPYTTSFITGARHRAFVKPPAKNPLRKVRSAAAVPKFGLKNGGPSGVDSSTTTSLASTPQGKPRLLPKQYSESTVQQSRDVLPQLERDVSSSVASRAPEPAIESPVQTTSVVDAIAQTMVGEWMWKYVRKRKSFGITESPQVEFEEGRNSNDSNNGIRHKRWVWLAPYERAVIWSSKQPMSGPALLGKGGRKLAIQSVLDVRDETPMPKNAGIQSTCGRSILILTPQRALKFTAPNRERHYVWLTALSFLSHSPLVLEDLAAVPPVPPAEYQLPPPPGGKGARHSPRDSISIVKSKERPGLHPRLFTAPTGKPSVSSYDGANDSVSDAAEPPQVPRVSNHNRKRSNTGPRPSFQSAFHSFPAHLGRPSSQSVKHQGAREGSAGGQWDLPSNDGEGAMMTRHMSETAATQPGAIRNDFFDAVGTVRMEAFVDKAVGPSIQTSGDNSSFARQGYRTRQGRKKDMSYWGIMGNTSKEDVSARQESSGNWRGGSDPFQGF
ncbi:MAG: hypothetical protein Q9222_007147 [Ikaeria aurantiellina]